MRLSVSKIHEHDQCPLRWKWRETGVPDTRPKFEGWRRGGAVHKGLEAAYAHAKSIGHDGPMHHPAILSVATAAVHDEALDAQLPREQWDGLVDQVVDYLVEQEVQADDVLDIEGFVQFVVRRRTDDRPGLQVIGFVDRLDRRPGSTIRIIDYKAMKRPEKHSAADMLDDLQVSIYQIAVKHRFPWVRRVEFQLVYTRSDDHPVVARSRDEIGYLERQLTPRLLDTEQRMEQGPWPPRAGDHCRTCPFIALCPAHDGVPPPSVEVTSKSGQVEIRDVYDPRTDSRNWRSP